MEGVFVIDLDFFPPEAKNSNSPNFAILTNYNISTILIKSELINSVTTRLDSTQLISNNDVTIYIYIPTTPSIYIPTPNQIPKQAHVPHPYKNLIISRKSS